MTSATSCYTTEGLARVDRSRPLSVSHAQERMWLEWKLAPQSAAYNVAFVVKFPATVAASTLERALRGLKRRHEVLRTRFEELGDGVAAVLVSDTAFMLPMVAVSDEDVARREMREQAAIPFDLASDAPFAPLLYELPQGARWLFVKMHHIVMDLWSVQIFLRELAAACAGSEPPEETLQYADFASWERQSMQGPRRERLLSYWKGQLAGEFAPLRLRSPQHVPTPRSGLADRVAFRYSHELAARLDRIALEARASRFMLLAAAFRVLLFRYTGQEDILIGTPVICRNARGTERMMGYFGNTLVLRNALFPKDTYVDVLKRERRAMLGALDHQVLPFELLIDELRRDRTMRPDSLVQVLFSSAEVSPALPGLPELEAQIEEIYTGTAKFPLLVSIQASGSELGGVIEFATDSFDRAFVEALADDFGRVLEDIACDADRRIGDLPLLSIPVPVCGDVDVRALAAKREAVCPRAVDALPTRTERAMLEIWRNVLGVGRVGLHDHLFDLGGHSLSGIRIIARARLTFGVPVQLQAIFKHTTPAALAAHVDRMAEVDNEAAISVPPLRVRGHHAAPATWVQRHLWLVHHVADDSTFLNLAVCFALRGPFDVPAAREAMLRLMERHAMLRARFEVRGKRLWYEPVPQRRVEVEFVAAAEAPEGGTVMWLESVQARAARAFDLGEGPCCRFAIARRAEDHHVVIIVAHHIVADEWSLGLLAGEFAHEYDELVSGRRPAPAAALTFADYAWWQEECLDGHRFDAQAAHWKEVLKPPLSRLRLGWRGEAASRADPVTSYPLHLELPLAERLACVGRQHRSSMFVVLLSAFERLLQRCSGESDIRVATNLAARHHPGLDQVIGPLTDTLILRTTIGPEHTALDALRDVRETFVTACGYHDVPFETVARTLYAAYGVERSSLAQAFFVFEEYPAPLEAFAGLVTEAAPVLAQADFFKDAIHDYDVILYLQRNESGIRGQLSLKGGGDLDGWCVQLLEEWRTLLEELAIHATAD